MAIGLAAVLAASVATVGVSLVTGGSAGATVGAISVYGGSTSSPGWFADEPALSPAGVTAGDFGQLWNANIEGQTYAQPLLDGTHLVVATERNKVYGLESATGTQEWVVDLGTPWDPTALSCFDLRPTVGVTGTGVIDTSSHTVYLVAKTYVSGSTGPAAWWMHALDTATGAERPGFPVLIQGTATNDPARTFAATTQHQRPGLLLRNGIVYAAFGGHCDAAPYTGWIVGVGTAGQIATMWTAEPGEPGSPGAGIWMSGAGIITDGPDDILISTGNGNLPPGPTAGSTPIGQLGEAVVRLQVQPDGSLNPTDFFIPYDAEELNLWDADFGSGAPLLLEGAPWSTPAAQRLTLAIGKQGYLYVLDADNLGGYRQGLGGGDAALGRIGPLGGTWSTPRAWSGDGGYVYVVTAFGGPDGNGQLIALSKGTSVEGLPTFQVAGAATGLGYGSGSPVITSSGTTPGSAVVWMIAFPPGSNQAQLRAYSPVPQAGAMSLLWSAPLGIGNKFTVPAPAGGKMYVAGEGWVKAFGSPVSPPVTAPPVAFNPTTVGQSALRPLSITANNAIEITAVTSSVSTVTIDAGTLPRSMAATENWTVPVTFAPTDAVTSAGTISIVTSLGTVEIPVTGTGRSSSASLSVNPPTISFGGVAIGSAAVTQTVTVTNTGASDATFTSVIAPEAPFSTSVLPAGGSILAAGQSVSVTVSMTANSAGFWVDELLFNSDAGTVEVPMSGSAAAPGNLTISSSAIDMGEVVFSGSASASFTLTNTGGSPVTINRSKPPGSAAFRAESGIPEGTVLAPGASVSATVTYVATVIGPQSATWDLNASDGLGARAITFSGVGISPPGLGSIGPPPAGSWVYNGVAALEGTDVVLTRAGELNTAGSAFWPVPISSSGLSVSFEAYAGDGNGADGLALVLGDAAAGAVPSVGAFGAGLGFWRIPALAVTLDTYATGLGEPNQPFVGLASGAFGLAATYLASSTAVQNVRGTPHQFRVDLGVDRVSVWVDGNQVLDENVVVPDQILLGFTAGTGGLHDRHVIRDVVIDTSGALGPLSGSGWTRNGAAQVVGESAVLTDAGQLAAAGSVFWNQPVSLAGRTVSFELEVSGGTGADGAALVLADPSEGSNALGNAGGGLGFAGIDGAAITFDTYRNAGELGEGLIGLTRGPNSTGGLEYVTTSFMPGLRGSTHQVEVSFVDGQVQVRVDGVVRLVSPFVPPPMVRLGFSAATGGRSDRHRVANVALGPANSSGAVTAIDALGTGGWTLNGTAASIPGGVRLTSVGDRNTAGSSWWPTALPVDNGLRLSFDVALNGDSNGADGMALVIGDPLAGARASSLGWPGGGLGYRGTPGVAVTFDSWQNSGEPADDVVGIATGDNGQGGLQYLATAQIPVLRNQVHQVVVTAHPDRLVVEVDGQVLLDEDVVLPASGLIGFTAGTGGLGDNHVVTNLIVTTAPQVGALGGPGWVLNGSAASISTGVQLTSRTERASASSAFWPGVIAVGDGLSIEYLADIGGEEQGADGLALVLADPALGAGPNSLGWPGGGLGYWGIPGLAITMDTWRNAGEPGDDLVGLAVGGNGIGGLDYLAAAPVAGLRGTPHLVRVDVTVDQVTVTVDGTTMISQSVAVPPQVLLGFTAATGGLGDDQLVHDLRVGLSRPAVSLATVPGPFDQGRWWLNGSAALVAGEVQLTADGVSNAAGSTFWPVALDPRDRTISFGLRLDGTGAGADGLALVLAEAAAGPGALGSRGSGIGFAGIPGLAVVFDTYANDGEPGANGVGISTGSAPGGGLEYLAWAPLADLRSQWHQVEVTVRSTGLIVRVDGQVVLDTAAPVPVSALVGFTAATGGLSDEHRVRQFSFASAPP